MANVTLSFFQISSDEVKFQAYYGSRNQETVCIDRAAFDTLCLSLGCDTLASYNDLVGTTRPVVKGEKAITVQAYVKRSISSEHPLTGEMIRDVRTSPRTIKLFPR